MRYPTMERAAREYIRRGFSVIPIHSPGMPIPQMPPGRTFKEGKAPYSAGHSYPWEARQHSRVGLSVVMGWIAQGLNLGIVTGAISGVVVIDLDSSAAIAWARANLPPSPWTVGSSQGKEHWYYAHPGRPVGNRVKLGGLIDIRGDGGYVVAPPSKHVSGAVYGLEGTWEGPAPDFPGDALDRLEGPYIPRPSRPSPNAPALSVGNIRNPTAFARKYGASYPAALKGERDNLAFRLACQLVHNFALSDDAALEGLISWASCRCFPPLALEELEAKVLNARKYGKGGK